jgi:class 3 adenylate cyclase
MTTREPKYAKDPDAPGLFRLSKLPFERFNSTLVGLTNLLENMETFDALAVILDLKDFTGFCDQREPHAVVPEFLESFLKWLFDRISEELLDHQDQENVFLWTHLPIFGKFLGDGVLLVWDVTELSGEARLYIVQAFDLICNEYERIFLKKIRRTFTRPPSKLRCGIAQGQVTSIANGEDYVGMCINIASRLQKLDEGAFSFAFTRKGLDEKAGADWYRDFVLIKIPIRGITREELVYVLRREHKRLPKKRQRELRP